MGAWRGFPRLRRAGQTRHIGRRLLLLYGLIIVTLAMVFSVALLYGSAGVEGRLAAGLDGALVRETGLQLRLAHAEADGHLSDYLRDGDEGSLSAYRAAVGRREAALGRLAQLTEGTATRGRVDELRPRFAPYDALGERAITDRRAAAGGRSPGAVAMVDATLRDWRAEGERLTGDLAARVDALAAAWDEEAERRLGAATRAHRPILLLALAFATVASTLGLWITGRIIRGITGPLEALAGAAAAIGAGDLETRVAPGLSAEFDTLGTVMNTMAGRLASSRRALREALVATERRNRELRTIGEVGDALDSSLDLDLILDRSLDVILAAFAADAGAIFLAGPEGGEASAPKGPPRGQPAARWRTNGGEDVPGTALGGALYALIAEPVLGGGRSLVVDLTHGEDGAAPGLRAAGYRSLVVVPLRAAGRTHGALAIVAGAAWSPDDRDRALLEGVGGQVARAVENAQLYVAEKQRSAEAGMLAQMAQLMVGTLDLDRLARLIARYAVRTLGVERCIVGFHDLDGRGTLKQIYQYGFPSQQVPLVEGGRETLQRIVLRHTLDSRTLVVADARSDDRPEVLALARQLDARSFISVPLLARGRPVGLIYLDTREPRQHAFGPQDQRILAAIADQAAAALEGARLYEAERRRGQQLGVLNEAGRRMVAASSPAELFEAVIAIVRGSFGYDWVAVALIEGDELVFVAGSGHGEGGVPPYRFPLDGPGLPPWAARAGRSLSVADVALDPRYIALGGEQCRSELVVPLRTKERVIGVLDVQSARAGAFGEDDEQVLSSLADQLGLAVENARLQERALALAVVDERNRLARELHDSVTQALFSMNLTIEAARMLLRRDVDATERQLAQLGERTGEALAEMRALIHSLRPAGMEERGLAPALTHLAERVRRENLLPVEVTIEGPPRLDERQEQELFRIAQEALNNAVKHAAATRVRIALATMPAVVLLTIEDDGKGFDPARSSRPDAFGLLGMRERAELLGGLLVLDSTPGEGTRVRVTIPRGRGAAPPTPPPRRAETGGAAPLGAAPSVAGTGEVAEVVASPRDGWQGAQGVRR